MRAAYEWRSLFNQSALPAYVSLLQPSQQDLPLDGRSNHKLEVIELDDSLDEDALEDGREPATFEVKQGSILLALPADAGPPWPFRVDGIWLLGAGELCGTTSAAPKAAAWEEQQIMQRQRVAAKHCALDVTYFYRVPELLDEVCSDGVMSALCGSLVALGLAASEPAAEALLSQHKLEMSRRSLMRYVIFSTLQARQQPTDEGQEPAVPLESVMAPAQVMFLPGNQRMPLDFSPVAAAAAGAAARPAAGRKGLGPELLAALQEHQQQQEQLAPGFVCNLIYVKQTGDLFGLQEWADGTAGAAIHGPWVRRSRKQAAQLLRESHAKLASFRQAAGLQGSPAQEVRQEEMEQQQQQQQQQEQQEQEQQQQQQPCVRGQSQRIRRWQWLAESSDGQTSSDRSMPRRRVVGLADDDDDSPVSTPRRPASGGRQQQLSRLAHSTAAAAAAAAPAGDGGVSSATGNSSGDQGGSKQAAVADTRPPPDATTQHNTRSRSSLSPAGRSGRAAAAAGARRASAPHQKT